MPVGGRREIPSRSWLPTRRGERYGARLRSECFFKPESGGGWSRLLTNVLSQMGLGYFFVFLLLGRSFRVQLVAALVRAHRLLGSDGDLARSRSLAGRRCGQHGRAERCCFRRCCRTSQNTRISRAEFDRWLLGTVNPGGFGTINFIPAAVTMLMGVMAGQLLRGSLGDREKLRQLLGGGAICMLAAVIASFTVCPIVKRIWSPSFTLFSGAWVLWMLALFYWLIDVRKNRTSRPSNGMLRRGPSHEQVSRPVGPTLSWWTYPLVVVGMNSLAIYMMAMLLPAWTAETLKRYLGEQISFRPLRTDN